MDEPNFRGKPDTLMGLSYRMRRTEERLLEIEKYKPEMMAYELGKIREELKLFRRSLTTLVIGVAVALIVYVVQKYAAGPAAEMFWW